MADEPLVLGIETSCDETGVGIVRGTTLLADAIASSVDEHARFGGVVPEVASRAHLEAMVPTIQRALKEAGVSARDLDGIAVTAGPGLAGALLVGVSAAKAYAYALGKPLYGVNHLASHICVDQLEHGPLPEPTMALLVSGGHSSLLLAPDITSDVRPLGATIDDAAGEAFDKIARVLNLGFPGGPVIDRYAKEGDPTAIAFPRGLTGPRDPAYDFSFSGLKTAVARWIEAKRAAGEEVPVRDVAASFQEAVVDVLTRKAVRACKDKGVDHLMIGGGVAANSRLRALAQERCEDAGIRLRVPRPEAVHGQRRDGRRAGRGDGRPEPAASDWDLSADSSLPVTEPHVPGATRTRTTTCTRSARRTSTRDRRADVGGPGRRRAGARNCWPGRGTQELAARPAAPGGPARAAGPGPRHHLVGRGLRRRPARTPRAGRRAGDPGGAPLAVRVGG